MEETKIKGEEYLVNIINVCMEKQKLASFYFNKEDNCAHLTGFIHAYNDNELLIAHITPRGEYDGFVLNKMTNLYRVDYDGNYEKKIQQLYKLKKQSHPIVQCNKDEIFVSLLKFACENEYLITLELENDSVTGYVDEYEDFISLQVLDENGGKNGKCIIDIDEVVTFSCDTDYEQDLKILNYAQKYSKKVSGIS